MPLKLSPTQIAFNARGNGRFNKPFNEQVEFFRQKLNIPTERYDDIRAQAHDRAFMVAGAQKADLLDDLIKIVDKSIAEGKSIGWFRKEFNGIVKQRGWEGWTGSDTKAGRDWRTRIIYRTNIASSYAAGRWQQLNNPALLKTRPYWKYIHNDTVTHPRPLHVSWSGLVLRHDNPFWQTHFPPNGWGCRCRITAVREKEFKGETAPDDGFVSDTDRPQGIDKGWDYAPGRSNAELLNQVIQKQDKAPWQLARSNVQTLIESTVFTRFFKGELQGEFPVAVLSDQHRQLLGTETATVLLSRVSVDEHISKHPEITIKDYKLVQNMIDNGDIYQQGETRLIYLHQQDHWYRLALKRTGDGLKNYFLTLFRNDKAKPPKDAVRIR